MVVGRVHREKIRSGRKAGRRFKGESGAGALHWQTRIGWTRLNSRDIQAGGTRRGTDSAGRCGTSRRNGDAAGRTASGMRAA